MNNVRAIQKRNELEAKLGLTDTASWHDQYKDSTYIYIGGLPLDLTEGDVIAIFSQYGEPVDINMIRDKKTGKSRGFAFLGYEDQRSTILAVDNLNGIKILERTLRVDHVADYKRPERTDSEGNVILLGDRPEDIYNAMPGMNDTRQYFQPATGGREISSVSRRACNVPEETGSGSELLS